jgi:hypothetical protein
MVEPPAAGGKAVTFAEFLMTRRITNNPRGEFIGDAQHEIRVGRFVEPTSLENLTAYLMRAGACHEAVQQGRQLWREYQRHR